MVGLTELESVTSCVSSRRSNQLSYRPEWEPLLILNHFPNFRNGPACPNREKKLRPWQNRDKTSSVRSFRVKPAWPSLAFRFSFFRASRFIWSFICEYFSNTFASPVEAAG